MLSHKRVIAAALLCMAGSASAAEGIATWVVEESTDGRRQLVVSLSRPMPKRSAREVVVADGVELPARVSEGRRRLVAAVADDMSGTFSQVHASWAGHSLLTERKDGRRIRRDVPVRPPPSPAPRKNIRLDPNRLGPWKVRRADYDFGDEVVPIAPLAAKGELRAAVYMPRGSSRRHPVVVLLHGQHPTCWPVDDIDVQGTVWPCPAPSMPVSSYQGYAGAGELLASHGYVVVSISANGINALDVEEVGGDQYIARGELVLQHLDLLRKANAGRVESLRALHGRLDMQRIGLMGHSRGGEGVVRAALLNAERGSPFGIRSLMPLASVNERSSIPGVPMASVLPYCDGDVSTLAGQAFVDDGAHAFGDSALRTTVLMMGANHNFYNSVWSEEGHGGDDVELASDFADDATCGVGRSTRLTQAEQEHLGAGYMAAWFRLTLGREGRFLPLFDGTSAGLRGLPRADVRSVPVLPSEDRLDVLTAALRLGDWRTGGGVQARWCAEAAVDIDDCPRREEEAIDVRQPHWSSGLGESGTMLRVDWAGAGTLSVMLPRQSRHTGRMERLSMRVMTGLSAPGGMRLTLHDRWGRRASVQLDAQTHAALGALPEVNGIGTSLLQAVQVPLARFRGIDLRHLRRLDIDREEPGTLFLTDVAFTRSSIGTAEHASHWPGIAVESQPPRDSRGPSERQDVRVTATLSGRQSYPVTVNVRLGADSRAVTVPPGNLCAGTSLQFAPSVDPDVDESMAFIASGNSSGGFTSNKQIPVGPAGVRNDGRTAVVCREK